MLNINLYYEDNSGQKVSLLSKVNTIDGTRYVGLVSRKDGTEYVDLYHEDGRQVGTPKGSIRSDDIRLPKPKLTTVRLYGYLGPEGFLCHSVDGPDILKILKRVPSEDKEVEVLEND